MTNELAASRLEKSTLLKEDEASTLLARESQVLLGGLADGSKDGLAQSVQSAGSFSNKLFESPGKTLLDFASAHIGEAATAAALSIAAPRGIAAALIAGISLRGTAVATWDAAKMAADPASSIKTARERYAQEMSREAQGILGSLPLTLLGASAGRSSANLMFGKNLAASDLIGGRLKVSDISNNLQNTFDQIRKPGVKLVVTDMDNTLLSTEKQQALGLEEAVKGLSAKTGIAEPELYSSLGKYMDKYHSHSYPWTLELALKDRLKIGEAGGISITQFEKDIAQPFWQTMDRSMQHLELYPGVKETLNELAKRNIPVAVLSDASASSGLRRFTSLKLDQAPIEKLFTLRNPAEPVELSEPLRLAGRERLNLALATEHSLKEFQVMPRDWEKPSAAGLETILDSYQVRPSQVLMIGDNLKRDMGVAANTGTRGIYARYNEAHPEFEEIMRRFKNADSSWTNKKPEGFSVPYEGEIHNYQEVLNFLAPKYNPGAIITIARMNGEISLIPPLVLQENRDKQK